MKQLYLLETVYDEDDDYGDGCENREPTISFQPISEAEVISGIVSGDLPISTIDIIKMALKPASRYAKQLKEELQAAGYISAKTAKELKALQLQKVNPRFAYGSSYGLREIKTIDDIHDYEVNDMARNGGCIYQEIDPETLPQNLKDAFTKIKKKLKEAAEKRSEAKRLKLQLTEAARVAEAKELLRKVGELK